MKKVLLGISVLAMSFTALAGRWWRFILAAKRRPWLLRDCAIASGRS
ncbi:hypothetical protein [Yersinia enterocolitica]|nr:hypothetical protein [Yersinia enterocolitica]